MIGKVLGRYRIVEELGQGGMAIVYKGIDGILDREVAVKVLHPHLSRQEEAKIRFQREAKSIAKLKHPNILEIYDFSGVDSPETYIVTEFVSGKSLRDFIDERPFKLPEIGCKITSRVADALAHAHDAGIIHRDIKPENVMVRNDGIIKLMDFGIAHVLNTEHLTTTGVIIGSPAHMSPEQIEGKNIDFRTDIFSLGTLLYLLVSDRLPFSGNTPHALLRSILEVNYEDPRRYKPCISDDLVKIIKKMMMQNPGDRYESAHRVFEDMNCYLAKYGITAIEDELKKFFRTPDTYENELKSKIIEHHVKAGNEAMAKQKIPEAMKHFDRVLSLDSHNSTALQVMGDVHRLDRNKRVKKITIIGAVSIMLFVVMSYFLVYTDILFHDSGNENFNIADLTVKIMKKFPPAQPRISKDNFINYHLRRPPDFSSKEGTSEEINLSEMIKNQQAKSRETGIPVMVQAHPPAVQIFIDRIDRGFGNTGTIKLKPGQHIVRLVHSTCEICEETTYTLNIDEKNPPQSPLRYSIKYKDAVLVVKSGVIGRVFINGVQRGKTNQPIMVRVTNPSEIKIDVKVESDNNPPRQFSAAISAGKTTTLNY
jgi:serine/threonine-protein kinase